MYKWMRDLSKTLEKEGYKDISFEHLTKHYRCSVSKDGIRRSTTISGTPKDEHTAIKEIIRQLKRQAIKEIQ